MQTTSQSTLESPTRDLSFITKTGERISIKNPRPEQINVLDIASGLAKNCRFCGQIHQFYSVAQHSVLVSRMAPAEMKLEALFHDGTEAYIHDVIKPLKVLIADLYGPIEDKWEEVIFEAFGLQRHRMQYIKQHDLLAYDAELALLKYQKREKWLELCARVNIAEDIWSPDRAEYMFLKEYAFLTGVKLEEVMNGI